MFADLAALAEAARIGRRTGHVIVSCPICGGCSMTALVASSGTIRTRPSSGGWPRCRLCREAPRTEPIGDLTLVRRIKYPAAPSLRRWAQEHGRADLLAIADRAKRHQRRPDAADDGAAEEEP